MEDRIAIITGATSGLGLAIATKFVSTGIHTLILGKNEEKARAAREQLGEGCDYILADLTHLSVLPGLVSRIKDQYGRIDILVNNAGVHLKKPMLTVSDEEFHKVILTNQTAVFVLSREVSSIMVQQGKGCIINISSMAAHYGIPQVVAYTAAKSAVEGMTRAMAVELSPLGVRVNCVAPGFIHTKMSAAALDADPARKARVLARTPLARLGCPEDVANAVYFLASDAASFITGTVLPVDGGNAIGF